VRGHDECKTDRGVQREHRGRRHAPSEAEGKRGGDMSWTRGHSGQNMKKELQKEQTSGERDGVN